MKKDPLLELAESVTTLASLTTQVAEQSLTNATLSIKLLDTELEYYQKINDGYDSIIDRLEKINKRLIKEREERERKYPILGFRRRYGNDMSRWPTN